MFQRPRARVNCQTPTRAPRARDAWRKFTKIYGNPRASDARALCIDFAVARNTVHDCIAWTMVNYGEKVACSKAFDRGQDRMRSPTVQEVKQLQGRYCALGKIS